VSGRVIASKKKKDDHNVSHVPVAASNSICVYMRLLWKRTHSGRSDPVVGARLSQVLAWRGDVAREAGARIQQGQTPHPTAINRLIDCPYATHLARVRGCWED
jgi:hypothetical protein